jgi:uncharacterized protein YbjT (DUF2867 family)
MARNNRTTRCGRALNNALNKPSNNYLVIQRFEEQMVGHKYLVIGGSGFLGSHLVQALAAHGAAVTVPTRNRERAKNLIVLPRVDVVQANVHDDKTLAGLMAGQTAVINLVGILHGRVGGRQDPYGPDFGKAHVELTKRLADSAVKASVRRFVQISALGVGEHTKRDAPSRYLRSKAAGEQVLRDTIGLDRTILRPSVIFGAGDKFLNVFATLQTLLPILLMPRVDAKFQPIWVNDVVRAIVNVLPNRSTYGKSYDLAGPKIYTLRELIEFVGQMTGHARPIIGLPTAVGRVQAAIMEFLPGPTLMSRDNVDSMKIDNVMLGQLSPDLRVTATALEMVAPSYLSKLGDRYSAERARAHR